MKRKSYATTREVKVDQLAGFVTFPIVNVAVWLVANVWRGVTQPSDSYLWLPWIVNGLLLGLLFIYRPQFGIGYIAFIAAALIIATVLGVLFVGSCFAWVVVLFVFASFGEMGNTLGFFGGMLLFSGLFIAGVIYLIRGVISWVADWWSGQATAREVVEGHTAPTDSATGGGDSPNA